MSFERQNDLEKQNESNVKPSSNGLKITTLSKKMTTGSGDGEMRPTQESMAGTLWGTIRRLRVEASGVIHGSLQPASVVN